MQLVLTAIVHSEAKRNAFKGKECGGGMRVAFAQMLRRISIVICEDMGLTNAHMRWCGVVKCGVVWCGAVRHGVAW